MGLVVKSRMPVVVKFITRCFWLDQSFPLLSPFYALLPSYLPSSVLIVETVFPSGFPERSKCFLLNGICVLCTEYPKSTLLVRSFFYCFKVFKHLFEDPFGCLIDVLCSPKIKAIFPTFFSILICPCNPFLWILLLRCYCIAPLKYILLGWICFLSVFPLFLRPIFFFHRLILLLGYSKTFFFTPLLALPFTMGCLVDNKLWWEFFAFFLSSLLKYSYFPVMSPLVVLDTIGLCDFFLSHACWRSSRYTNLPFFIHSFISSIPCLFLLLFLPHSRHLGRWTLLSSLWKLLLCTVPDNCCWDYLVSVCTQNYKLT